MRVIAPGPYLPGEEGSPRGAALGAEDRTATSRLARPSRSATVCGSGSAFHASRWPDDGGFHHDLPPEACFSRRRTPRLQGGSPARASHLLCAAERERRRGQELSCSSPLRPCFWRVRRVARVSLREQAATIAPP